MRRTTILVADDHSYREGGARQPAQRTRLRPGRRRETDGVALVDEARRLRPDVIISDISMPRLSGLEALERITAEHLPCKISSC
jgi:DNA-binding NarL/FixJ family response regulator